MGQHDAAITAAMNQMDLHPEQKRKVRKALEREFAEADRAAAASKKVQAAATGEHPVEAAIREGKIPESRRSHYYNLYAKKPKKTTRILASLEAVLEPPEVMEGVREFVEERPQAAPVAAAAAAPSGPTDYPAEWLDRGGVVGGPPAVGGNVIQEPGVGGAPVAAGPGEVL